MFNNGINAFQKYIESHPTKLNEYINNKVLPENTYREYHNFKWFDDMKGKDEKLEYFEETIRTIYNELQMAKQVAVAEEKYSDADYYTRQIDKLQKTGVVESLSKYCVIPKYGFPVDVVELRVYNELSQTIILV